MAVVETFIAYKIRMPKSGDFFVAKKTRHNDTFKIQPGDVLVCIDIFPCDITGSTNKMLLLHSKGITDTYMPGTEMTDFWLHHVDTIE